MNTNFICVFTTLCVLVWSMTMATTSSRINGQSPDEGTSNPSSTILTTGSTSNSFITTTTTTTTSSSSSPPPLPTNVTPHHHLSIQDWQLLIRSFEFLIGVQRVVFDLCWDDFFTKCMPALQNQNSYIEQAWNAEDYRCTPQWCACYDGSVRLFGNRTACLAPPITGGIVQVCHEVEICNPMRYRCADDFIYVQKQLPTQCDAFLNCSLERNVVAAAVIQCNGDLSQCNADLACQVQADPLDQLPPPTTPAPFQWDSSLPQALRDIWIVTAAIFGLVLAVAIVAVVLMRHRQRQWQQWTEQENEMSMERADDVVWFEPEQDDDEKDSVRTKKSDEAATAATATMIVDDDAIRRPKNLSCVRCGNKNAPIQLLPCRCRWCGCAEPDSYTPPVSSVVNDEEVRGGLSVASPREGGGEGRDEEAEQHHQQQQQVQVSSLSCRGVPIFTGKISKSIVDLYHERERQRLQRVDADNAAIRLSGSGGGGGGGGGADDIDAATRRARNLQKSKPPRPKCDRCHRAVNFCVNFDSLFYPAASHDVSENGEQAHEGNESTDNDEDKDEEEEDEDDDHRARGGLNVNLPEGGGGGEEDDDNDHHSPLVSSVAPSSPSPALSSSRKQGTGKSKSSSSSSSTASAPTTAARLTSSALVNVARSMSAPASAAAAAAVTTTIATIAAFSPTKTKTKKKIPTCCICLSEPCSVAIIPCGHVAQCPQCAKKLCVPVARADAERKAFVISSKCPLCREDIVAMASLSKRQNQKAFEQSASAVE